MNTIGVYETLARLQKQEEEKGIEPAHVLYEQLLLDLTSQVRDELRDMCKQKKVAFHKTLNSVSFEIV